MRVLTVCSLFHSSCNTASAVCGPLLLLEFCSAVALVLLKISSGAQSFLFVCGPGFFVPAATIFASLFASSSALPRGAHEPEDGLLSLRTLPALGSYLRIINLACSSPVCTHPEQPLPCPGMFQRPSWGSRRTLHSNSFPKRTYSRPAPD